MGNKGGKKKKKMEHKRVRSLGAIPIKNDGDKKHGHVAVTMADFETLKNIGKGAFGEVRLIRGKEDSLLYAAKIMTKKNLKSSQIPRLLAERDLMAFADHEYIVKLHYSFQDEEKLYLIMDFMQGGDLMGLLIEKDVFSVEATRFYIGELCLAVHSVHLLGYCHRDLKPDNILLASDGHVKLADFGLAKQLNQGKEKIPVKAAEPAEKVGEAVEEKATRLSAPGDTEVKEGKEEKKTEDMKVQWKEQKKILAHSMVGTPDYMAPEIFTSSGYDEECDWWGVGCIMFECLAGYAPFYSGGECDIRNTVHNVRNWKSKLHLDRVKRADKSAADLISKLICDHKNRLNFQGIKSHNFFKKFDWDDAHSNKAPYHSEQLENDTDTRYFNYESSDDDDEEDARPAKDPIVKIEDFTFYIQKDGEDPHHLTDLWTGPHPDAES